MNRSSRPTPEQEREVEASWLAYNEFYDDAEEHAPLRVPFSALDGPLGRTISPDATRTEDVTEYAACMRGALPSTGDTQRQSIDGYYAVRDSSQSEAAPAHSGHRQENPRTPDVSPCLLPYRGDFDDDTPNDFEPVGDLPSLPRLDFRPFILRTWVLVAIILFYANIIAGLATLYYYQNKSRIFHVHATASRFTIRILPSLIGTVSTIMFQSVYTNYARVLPYVIMAQPTNPQEHCERAERTLLAPYFPFVNTPDAFANRHYLVAVTAATSIFVNPFITPAKSTLIRKTPSVQDPDSWAITISSSAALYLMFNYLVLICLTIIILASLSKKRTGLKWDPVSIADQIMLLQGSDLLDDFSGLEYFSSSFVETNFLRKAKQFHSLRNKQYRLGYWLHRPTQRYWYGIRKWPAGSIDFGNWGDVGTRSVRVMQSAHNGKHPRKSQASSDFPGDARRDATSQPLHRNSIPAITDQNPEAIDWWRARCREVLDDPSKCYSGVYLWINDYTSTVVYGLVVASAAAGLWTMFTGHLHTGFAFPEIDYQAAYFVLTFVPTFWFGLINNFWYQADIWYRQLQMYMGLRQPNKAADNLLLGYPCDLPVVITIKALANSHWRLALTSSMPLIHRLIPVLAGSLFTVDRTSSPNQFHILIAGAQFKFVVGLLCVYIVLIPVVWPGLDRRLPIVPFCMADHITLYYDSTLVHDSHDIFLPHRRMDEERWHMVCRLRLAERRYGFGIYPGRYGALHMGIDDVYRHHNDEIGEKMRFLAPLRPPVRLHRRWIKTVWARVTSRFNVKRQPTFKEEELEVLHRLNSEFEAKTSSTATAAEVFDGEGVYRTAPTWSRYNVVP